MEIEDFNTGERGVDDEVRRIVPEIIFRKPPLSDYRAPLYDIDEGHGDLVFPVLRPDQILHIELLGQRADIIDEHGPRLHAAAYRGQVAQEIDRYHDIGAETPESVHRDRLQDPDVHQYHIHVYHGLEQARNRHAGVYGSTQV